MTKKAVYLETSVISYLAARPSPVLVVAAHQQITRDWWETRRQYFETYISSLVIDEASKGDESAINARLEKIANIPALEFTEAARDLIDKLIAEKAVPAKAIDDAGHVAIAATNNIDYLLTWNCRHLDNAEIKPLIRSVCAKHGYICPEICTPEELMGVNENEG